MDGTLNGRAAGDHPGARGASYSFQVGSTVDAAPTLNISGLAVKNTDANGMQINAGTRRHHHASPSSTTSPSAAAPAPAPARITPRRSTCRRTGARSTAARHRRHDQAVARHGDGTSNGETRAALRRDDLRDQLGASASDRSARPARSRTTTATTTASPTARQRRQLTARSSSSSAPPRTTRRERGRVPDGGVQLEHVHLLLDLRGVPRRAPAGRATSSTCATRRATRSTPGPSRRPARRSPGRRSGSDHRRVTTHYVYVATSAGTRLPADRHGDRDDLGDADARHGTAPAGDGEPLLLRLHDHHAAGHRRHQHLLGEHDRDGRASGRSGQSIEIAPRRPVTPHAKTVTTTGTSVDRHHRLDGLRVPRRDRRRPGASPRPPSAATQHLAGTHRSFGRISVGPAATTRVYAGDAAGTMWAIDPTSATSGPADGLWKYPTANAIKSSPYYDTATDTVQFGTRRDDHRAQRSGAVLNAGYPYTPAAPAIRSPRRRSTTTASWWSGRRAGSSTSSIATRGRRPPVSIIQEYNFGPTESVSGIGFDPTSAATW